MKKVKVYYMENCPYCRQLMDGLDELKIEYDSIDVDSEEGEQKFLKLYEVTKSENIPIVIVGKQVLVPEISFNTIEQALKLIQKLFLASP